MSAYGFPCALKDGKILKGIIHVQLSFFFLRKDHVIKNPIHSGYSSTLEGAFQRFPGFKNTQILEKVIVYISHLL